MLPYLSESIRAFFLTQRGHGDSSRPEAAYRFQDFTTDAAAFIDALDVETAVVVGHSLGSAVAQRFAIDYPERTLGLVLVGSFLSLANSQALRELWHVVSTMEDPVDAGFVRDFQESTIVRPVRQEFLKKTVMPESVKTPARVWREVVRGTM